METFLSLSQDEEPVGRGVASWVERDFRRYLRCRILAHGFARVRCGDCGHERHVASSCKEPDACPSCNTRRMAEEAAHLTDRVLPRLPVRRWVLSVPKRLRRYLHHDPEAASGVFHSPPTVPNPPGRPAGARTRQSVLGRLRSSHSPPPSPLHSPGTERLWLAQLLAVPPPFQHSTPTVQERPSIPLTEDD